MTINRALLTRTTYAAGALIAVLSIAACTPARGKPSALAPRPSSTGSRSVSSEMIAKWNVQDAFDAIVRAGGYSLADNSRGGVSVRQRRGQTSITNSNADKPVLLIDGAQMRDYDMLRQVRAIDIDRIDFLSPGDAAQRFGTLSSGAGAIIVLTRSRAR